MKTISLIWPILLFSALYIFAQSDPIPVDSEIYKTANSNIEKFRKADFSIHLNGINKKDLKNIEIEVEQTSHDFLFGCIIFG